ncbi:MAG: hypothetical protein AW07_03603 [Candidatus Accumulibacter sp. SK-11]|nr:MAG: hypothetical protein AW07_03603 [Candidatus Accumulibacter sp. SK-11]
MDRSGDAVAAGWWATIRKRARRTDGIRSATSVDAEQRRLPLSCSPGVAATFSGLLLEPGHHIRIGCDVDLLLLHRCRLQTDAVHRLREIFGRPDGCFIEIVRGLQSSIPV